MWRRTLPFAAFALVLTLACLLARPVTAQGGYELVPLTTPATSSSWDGDAKNGVSGTIDLSAVFGLPAGIKAVAVRISAADETTGVNFGLGPNATFYYAVFGKTQVANMEIAYSGVVPCDGGDIYFYQAGELDAVYITIYGYFVDPVSTATAVPTDTPAPTHTLVPTDTPQPTHTLVPTHTPVPTETPGWYVLTLTPPAGGGSSYDPDPFHTVVTQTLSTGNEWAFVREVDTGDILIGGLGLAILAAALTFMVIRR